MYFSISNKAFYAEDIDYGDSLPIDIIRLTDAEYKKYFECINSERILYLKDGVLEVSEKKPSTYHSWDSDSLAWIITEDSQVKKTDDEAKALISQANTELSRATQQIAILTDKVDLGVYSSGESEESISELIVAWKKYRINCSAVSSGSDEALASAPDSTD